MEHIKKNHLEFKTKVCFKTIYNYIHNHIFLNVNKLENGLLELHPSSFSPASLIQQCTEGMRMQAEKKHLALSSSYHDEAAEQKGLAADAWHHRSDALSSIGTAIGIGGAILLGKGWAVLDPVAALVVSVFIVKTALGLLTTSSGELLEKSLPKEVEKKIVDIVESEPEVSKVHHLCTRRIGNNIAIEMHIRMPGDISLKDSHTRASDIERKLRQHFGEHTHINLHVEPLKD